MKKTIFFVLVVSIFIWGSPMENAFSADGEEALAVIISVDGTVNVRSKNTSFPAQEATKLYEGDIISTARLSRVSLLYLDEELIQIPAEQELKITGDELSMPEQGKFAELKYILSAAYTGMKSSLFPQAVISSPGAARKWHRIFEAETIDLVMPVTTKVLSPYPHFRWEALQEGIRYEINLFNGLGELLWRQETLRNQLDYPKEAPALIPGEYYFWQVRKTDEKDWESFSRKNLYLTAAMAYFSVMPEEKRQEVQKTVVSAKQLIGTAYDENFSLLLGIYYEKQQLYGAAQREYEKIINSKPANKIYQSMLMNLYVKIGRKWAAFGAFD